MNAPQLRIPRKNRFKSNHPHPHQKRHSPTAYQVVGGEMFDDRQVHLSPMGVKGYFTPGSNKFVPLSTGQLRRAGQFKRPGQEQKSEW